MAQPITALYTTGQHLYAVLISPSGTWWNGATFEAYNSGHWSTYAVPLTEYTGSGVYSATYPVSSPTVLTTDVIYLQAGGSPTLGDTPAANFYQSQGFNLGAIAGDYTGPIKLQLTLASMLTGAVVAGTLTPSSFPTNLISTTNAAYQGRICLFTSGALINQVGNIVAYSGSTFTITVGGPYTASPSIGDTFVIV